MNLFQETSYKRVIQARVKEVGQIRKAVNLRYLADRLGIQYTYLSRVLNQEKAHLNEDQLFDACQLLDFYPEETEYVLLLRGLQTAESARRRESLSAKLEKLRAARDRASENVEFSSLQLMQEMSYLFDPTALLVYVALNMKKYREQPVLLCAELGLSEKELQEKLVALEKLGFVELGQDRLTIREVHSKGLHYGLDHPLMRAHQSLMRMMSSGQLLRTPEGDKTSFMVTFAANEEVFAQVRKEFDGFIARIRDLARKNAARGSVYQLCFDLFKWF